MQWSLTRPLLLALAWLGPLLSLPGAEADPNTSPSGGATDDAATAMRRFRVAPGLKVDLFAAEPMIQNVVSFAFDEQGRCYVVESFRRRTSVFDIRGLGEWLDHDFSFRTVEDRANFFKSTLSPANPSLDRFLRSKRGLLADFNKDGKVDWHDLEVETERIRLLVDTNADGRADVAATLAEGFDGLTSGVAAGVLARKGEVWFTCIPDLWRITNSDLRLTSGLPSADSMPVNPHLVNRKSQIVDLLSGFGVHIAFGGHDLHGLKLGPDGKMYFSIADRGTGTNLWDRIIDHWPGLTMEALADSGAVFRCAPDGTQLEVVAIGLRNPQELAFDEFGHLFTGDNNGDGGDKARWEYIVEGADYGWRMGWQHLPRMGAWNSEMLWGLAGTNTSSYYLPPVAHIGAGPSGVAYYPGTGLPARYDRHFFMCDFRGGPNSVVRAFALRPQGASFEAFDETEFLTGPLCVDVDFGLDGAIYVSDWVKGWDKTDKGRIYRVFDPNTVNDPAVLEVKKLLGEGMEQRLNEELARLLGHRDMRVRLEAQWELAARSDRFMANAVRTKEVVPLSGANPITFLHGVASNATLPLLERTAALWACVPALQQEGQVRLHPTSNFSCQAATYAWPGLRKLGEPDVLRALAWRVTGYDRHPRALVASMQGIGSDPLRDTSKQVRFFMAETLGKIGQKDAMPLLVRLLREAGDDAYLRHAAVFALARIGDVPALLVAAKDESPAVRLGVCLALRRLQRAEVAQFLNDADPHIVLEAARAIHDVPIPGALPELAKLLSRSSRGHEAPSERTGKDQSLVTSAATKAEGFTLRRALNAHFRLGADENVKALANFAASDAPEALRAEAIDLLALWPKPPGRDRVVGLWRPLPPRDGAVAAKALASVLPKIESAAPSAVKVAAKKAAASLGLNQNGGAAPSGAEQLAKFSAALESGSLSEKQNALAALAAMEDSGAAKLLSAWTERLGAGKVPHELLLDVLDAAQKNPLRLSSAATEGLKRFEAARAGRGEMAKWRECLYGGNAEEGKKTFIERQDAACFRCHKVNGEGGEVGPEMAGLGAKQSREYLLESILFPNKTIAPGFESVLITLHNGKSHAGILKSESAAELVIQTMEDGVPELVKVRAADVKSRDRGLSAMPEELGNILSKTDLRNLIEFLSTLK